MTNTILIVAVPKSAVTFVNLMPSALIKCSHSAVDTGIAALILWPIREANANTRTGQLMGRD